MSRRIRLAEERDLPAINAIYNHYVAHSTCTYQLREETAEARRAWFLQHDARHPVTVIEESGEVLGWGAVTRFHPREAFDGTVEDSIYVRHDQLHRGLGSALLDDLIARAKAAGFHTMIAGISAEQAPSIALHARFGFVERGRLREVGRKFGQWLDLVTMQLWLAQRAD